VSVKVVRVRAEWEIFSSAVGYLRQVFGVWDEKVVEGFFETTCDGGRTVMFIGDHRKNCYVREIAKLNSLRERLHANGVMVTYIYSSTYLAGESSARHVPYRLIG
jgi:hypothetical protein